MSASQDIQALELNSDSTIATAGYYQLNWSGNAETFQLQESSTSDFNAYKVIYEGKDLARVISGKPDGDYYYRVKTSTSDSAPGVSNVVEVTVAHHPLQNAILFFLAGAIVFIAILVLILKGNKLANN